MYSPIGTGSALPYRLDTAVVPGSLVLPTLRALQVPFLNTCYLSGVSNGPRTVVLHNSTRIKALGGADDNLNGAIFSKFGTAGSPIDLEAGGTALIDLQETSPTGCDPLDITIPRIGGTGSVNLRSHMNALYAAWDANKSQPLFANEVALQIKSILDSVIANVESTRSVVVENILVIGNDDIIPFLRVPDETTLGNEAEYLNELGGYEEPNGLLRSSLFYRFVLTDNAYADRAATPYKGRFLYIPDLGIGRLAASPQNILAYLEAYDYFPAGRTPDPRFAVNANRTDDRNAGAAFVTGYDFLTDQAERTSAILRRLGFSTSSDLGRGFALRTLISETWDVNDLANAWFTGQLPLLKALYEPVNTPADTPPRGTAPRLTPQTDFHLMSINAHFTHYDAIPANLAGGTLAAQRVLTPTLAVDGQLGRPAYERAFFKDYVNAGSMINDSATLAYSVGCHSGLSVEPRSIRAGPDQGYYQSSWPEAILKQGGNWIGNTGYGYGDSDVIGYSERLSVLFTEAIGRDLGVGDAIYPEIGESLALAKRRYLELAGPGSFSAFDEKVLNVWTLYGLPFIKVRVPTPFDPRVAPVSGRPFAAPAIEVPNAQLTNTGLITRRIQIDSVITNTAVGSGFVPEVTATISDSYRAANDIVTLRGISQTGVGRPVLPVLTYDITTQPTDNDDENTSKIPQPRGFRLISITSDTIPFKPHVTNIVTEETYLDHINGTEMPTALRDSWLPEQPFNIERVVKNVDGRRQLNDLLILSPTQLRATDGRTGELRRISQLVIEIIYIDPRTAPAATRNDDLPPLVTDPRVALLTSAGPMQLQAVGGKMIRISARVTDDKSGVASVRARAVSGSGAWQPVTMTCTNGLCSGTTTASGLGRFSVIIEAEDAAGNIATETARGGQLGLSRVILPRLGR